MYLRIISNEGVETIDIGKESFHVMNFGNGDHQESFNKMVEGYAENAYCQYAMGVIQFDGGRIWMFPDKSYYIMNDEGQTFERLSVPPFRVSELQEKINSLSLSQPSMETALNEILSENPNSVISTSDERDDWWVIEIPQYLHDNEAEELESHIRWALKNAYGDCLFKVMFDVTPDEKSTLINIIKV